MSDYMRDQLSLLDEKIRRLELHVDTALDYHVQFTGDLDTRLTARQEEILDGVQLLSDKLIYLIREVRDLQKKVDESAIPSNNDSRWVIR